MWKKDDQLRKKGLDNIWQLRLTERSYHDNGNCYLIRLQRLPLLSVKVQRDIPHKIVFLNDLLIRLISISNMWVLVGCSTIVWSTIQNGVTPTFPKSVEQSSFEYYTYKIGDLIYS